MVWRKIEITVLMRAFARAFDVEPPRTATLEVYREFTAACMEAALVDDLYASMYRARLGEEARKIGAKLRAVPIVRILGPSRAVRMLYRGISIELKGDLPGPIAFGPCYFAARYTPEDCWLMSAFDEGIMRGITGCTNADLSFACRITEGAPCCRACFDVTERK